MRGVEGVWCTTRGKRNGGKERKNKKILRCENCKAKPILTYKVDYDIILL